MRPKLFVLAPATALALAACTAGTPDADLGSGPVAESPAEDPAGDESTPAEPEPTTEPTDEGAPGDDAAAGDGDWLTVRDGVWQVGEAGEVEFSAAGGSLELVEVRPAEGWTITEERATPGQIDVDLRQGAVEYEVEIELENGILEIEIDQDIESAEAGRYDVGVAGVVEFAVTGDGVLELVDVVANEGWTIVEQEVDGDDIEVEFRNGPAKWEFDVDLGSDGTIEIDIDYEIEGPFEG